MLKALAKLGRAVGHFQAQLVLSVIFLVLLWPMGLLVRLKDPLRKAKGLPGWVPRQMPPSTLERFGHPF